MAEKFKLTYATMFNPPEELHNQFDEALAKTRSQPGQRIRHDHQRQRCVRR